MAQNLIIAGALVFWGIVLVWTQNLIIAGALVFWGIVLVWMWLRTRGN